MSVLRTQDRFVQDVTLVAATALEVTLERPKTVPGLTNNIDHVTNPPARREWEGGKVLLDFVTALIDLRVTKLEIIQDSALPEGWTEAPEPAGSAAEPLFPTGAPGDPEIRVAYENAVGELVTGASLVQGMLDFLKNLTIRANETFRITLLSAAGGAVTVNATYDAGSNNSDLNTQA